MKEMKLYEREAEKISQEILDGKYGKSGEIFVTTKQLAKNRNISLVTAQRLMELLRKKYFIRLIGRKYYLAYKRAEKNTALDKLFSNSKFIGMHISNLNNPYFSLLATKAEYYARLNGFNVLIASSSKDATTEKKILDNFLKLRVAGLISCPKKDNNLNDIYEKYPLPYVFLSHKLDINNECIEVNNIDAAKVVAHHFISEGYTNFAYIKPDSLKNHDVRILGFQNQLESENFNLLPENILSIDINNTGMDNIITTFLYKCPKPIAIFCFNDLFALKVVDSCKKLKLNIPVDVGIVGFDNLEISQKITPPLSTVSYRADKMAEMAILRLIEKINRRDNHMVTSVEPILMVRESSIRSKYFENT